MQKSNCCNAEISATGGTTQFFTCSNCKEACDAIGEEAYDQIINIQIKRHSEEGELDTNNISDGYHTFGELYKHRIHLYIALCHKIHQLKHNYKMTGITINIFKSKKHNDGSCLDGWFIVQIEDSNIGQISYHLPIEYWDTCSFMDILDKANKWDGHTSDDVLERLLKI